MITFRDWIDLDLKNLTWEQKFLNEFENLWDYIFQEDELESHFKTLKKIKAKLSYSPLLSWFKWLERSYVIYHFEFNGYSINDLALTSNKKISDISFILRNYYAKAYPQHEFALNEKLFASFTQDLEAETDFNVLSSITEEIKKSAHIIDLEGLKNIEIALFEEWKTLILFDDRNSEKQEYLEVKKKSNAKKILLELSVLFVLGGFLVIGLKFGSLWYENYLSKKITLFEPYFFWLDKNISFQVEDNNLNAKSAQLPSYNELEKLEGLEDKLNVIDDTSSQRFDVESDVVITSFSNQVKNFDLAESEKSSYEEKKKGGYRNFSYGRRRAYRVMMTSIQPSIVKEKIKTLMSKYNIKKLDKVTPGKEIPGGIYFNLHVETKEVKDFLSQVDLIEKTTILESNTIFGGPKGMSKVFIWVKSI